MSKELKSFGMGASISAILLSVPLGITGTLVAAYSAFGLAGVAAPVVGAFMFVTTKVTHLLRKGPYA